MVYLVTCKPLDFRSKELKMDDGSKSSVHRCPDCSYENANPKLVQTHRIMHSNPQLKCSYCGHLDHYPSRMARHVRRRHRGMAVKYTRLRGPPAEDSMASLQHAAADDDDTDGNIVQNLSLKIAQSFVPKPAIGLPWLSMTSVCPASNGEPTISS